MPMPFIRWIVLASAALALGGCFVSVMPLFGPDEADMPLADGAVITAYALDDKGVRTDKPPSHIAATRKKASYVFTPDDDEPFRAMFDDIGDGYMIGVILDMDVTKPPLYGLFHKVGDSWFGYAPVCADFRKLAAEHGKSLDDFRIDPSNNGSDCRFRKYDDLKSALMFLAAYSLPSTEYVLAKK
jgi:hypothetical protein